MGKGESNKLGSIGRVGDDFLIAGRGGVETHLAQRVAGGTKPVIIISAPLLSSSLSFEPLALLPSAYHSELL